MASASSSKRFSNGFRSIKSLTIGTFNVRGLCAKSKQQQLLEDAKKFGLNVCCIQETKLPHGEDGVSNGWRLVLLPGSCRHYGLGFVIAPWLNLRLVRCWSASDRVAAVQFSFGKNIISIINVYVPTSSLVAISSRLPRGVLPLPCRHSSGYWFSLIVVVHQWWLQRKTWQERLVQPLHWPLWQRTT